MADNIAIAVMIMIPSAYVGYNMYKIWELNNEIRENDNIRTGAD